MSFLNNIFKKSKFSDLIALTNISRTETIKGISIPGIIWNMQYHFTDLQVYSDGLVNCWDMVDLSLFKDKINKNWVVTSIPNGQSISIFSLGHWVIDNGEWEYTKETFYEHVSSLVKQLNPKLENLHNCHGTTTEKIGTVNVSKHKSPNPKPYYEVKPNSIFTQTISGEKFYVFHRNDDKKIYLANLSIYENGHVEITNIPQKKSFEFSDVRRLIDTKVLFTDIPFGERITISGLGSFVATSGNSVDIESKYDEFLDKYNSLSGKEDSINKCRRIFEKYKSEPSIDLKNELKKAYEEVPKHQRMFVGNMDTKDYEVRFIIYGNKVKKEWEEDYGYEYPYDDLSKPTDE